MDRYGHVKLLNIIAHGKWITGSRSRESCDLYYVDLETYNTHLQMNTKSHKLIYPDIILQLVYQYYWHRSILQIFLRM